jgi:hypothetical protein
MNVRKVRFAVEQVEQIVGILSCFPIASWAAETYHAHAGFGFWFSALAGLVVFVLVDVAPTFAVQRGLRSYFRATSGRRNSSAPAKSVQLVN